MFLKFVFSILIFGSLLATAAPLPYSSGEQKFDGLFLPAGKKNAPGIVLIHNWMGITQETEKQAARFQKLGYNILIADIYGSGVRPKDSTEAGQLAGRYKGDRALLRERVKFAMNALENEMKKQKNKSTKIAVIGYCFGGTAAIESARAGYDVTAVVSFHGGLDSPKPEDGARIKSKILVLHGAIDPYVKAEDINSFEMEMQKYKIDYEFIKYSGAVHSFTEMAAGNDATKGAAYNESADRRSFARAKEFLEETLH